MKTEILLVVIAFAISNVHYASSDSETQLNARFLPPNLVENSDGFMQVFLKQSNSTSLGSIGEISAKSLDPSILKITDIRESESDFISEVYFETGKPGATTVYLISPGFSPTEIPVSVYGSKYNPEQLLVKTFYSSFVPNYKSEGLISVELADEDGFPVKATKDIIISLSTLKNGIVKLLDENLFIKKDEYFTSSKFDITGIGDETIYVKTNSMETKSAEIKILGDDDLTVKLFTFPKKINTFNGSEGHIIAQLQDSSGKPVIAQKDITLYLKITDSLKIDGNTSDKYYNHIRSVGFFVIPKGSYWGYTPFSSITGAEDTYEISISSEDPLTIESTKIEAVNLKLWGDKFVKFSPIPVLATGDTELIGVIYLEESDGDPLVAEKDLLIKIDSSDERSLSVPDTLIKKGSSSALVFGEVGFSAPSKLELLLQVEGGKKTLVEMHGLDKGSLKLVADPLIEKVLTGTEVPVVLYVKDDNGIGFFPQNSDLFVSHSKNIEIVPEKIKPGEIFSTIQAKSLKKGEETLTLEVGDLKTQTIINSLSTSLDSLFIDHFDKNFPGIKDVFVVQGLNSQGLPVFAENDIDVTLHLKDKSLIKLPESVTIDEGDYYTTFQVEPIAAGTTELSTLTHGLEPSTFEIKVTSLKPEITIEAPDVVDFQVPFTTNVSVNHDGLSLSEMEVEWAVDGGAIQISDTKTGMTGEALAMIIPQSKDVSIQASVTGSLYDPVKIVKLVNVNATSIGNFAETDSYEKYKISGIDPIPIIVPLGIVLTGIIMKKKNMLKLKN